MSATIVNATRAQPTLQSGIMHCQKYFPLPFSSTRVGNSTNVAIMIKQNFSFNALVLLTLSPLSPSQPTRITPVPVALSTLSLTSSRHPCHTRNSSKPCHPHNPRNPCHHPYPYPVTLSPPSPRHPHHRFTSITLFSPNWCHVCLFNLRGAQLYDSLVGWGWLSALLSLPPSSSSPA